MPGSNLHQRRTRAAADVGISVDGAVDVAKEAADMSLLEHDLGVLHESGRGGASTRTS